jgi:membrane protein DedA with SNARE-associated domain
MVLLQSEYIPGWLDGWLTSEFGLIILLGLCLLEGTMMLRFMPSELVVPAALLVIGSSIPTVFAIVTIAVVGTTIGQAVLFVVVRRGGREYVLERGWIPISETRLDRFDAWFDRWGLLAVPISNTMLFVRGICTFPAGLSTMRLRTFVVLSAVGSLSFQSILAGLYLAGEQVIVF